MSASPPEWAAAGGLTAGICIVVWLFLNHLKDMAVRQDAKDRALLEVIKENTAVQREQLKQAAVNGEIIREATKVLKEARKR